MNNMSIISTDNHRLQTTIDFPIHLSSLLGQFSSFFTIEKNYEFIFIKHLFGRSSYHGYANQFLY